MNSTPGIIVTTWGCLVLMILLGLVTITIRGDIHDLRSACVQEAPSEQP